MGAISEQVRTTPVALRSAHPHVSFAALGPQGRDIIAAHPIEAWLTDGSPLQRLYDADAKVLLLGTTYATCTAFHLSEHRAGLISFTRIGAPVLVNGSRRWLTFDAPSDDATGFEALGTAMEASIQVSAGKVGMADCRLFSLRAAVNFAGQHICSGRQA
jgi:aminoglycoside 3-N-acetyltransferase